MYIVHVVELDLTMASITFLFMQMINIRTGQGFIEKIHLAQVGSLNFHTDQGFIETISLHRWEV